MKTLVQPLNDIKKPGIRNLFSGLLPLFMLAHFGHHLVNSLPIPLLPMIRSDFGLDYTQSGLLISSLTLTYGITQMPAGWLADRLGPRTLLSFGICGVALAGFLVGLSKNYVTTLIFLALMGVLGGGYHPAAPPLISASVDPKNRGRAMGLHMAGGSVPFFLAPLIAVAIASVLGWRGSFIVLSVPTMILGIVFYILLGRLIKTEKDEHAAGRSQHKAPSPQSPSRRLVPFIIISTFAQAVTFSVITFVPLFLVDQFSFGKETAAAFLSIFYSAGLWASLFGGYLSDRLGGVPVVLAACFISGPVIYMLNLAPNGFGIGFLLLLLGMCNYFRTPVSESYIVSQTTERHRSTVLGIYYFSCMEGGGALSPVMGFLIDRYGLYTSFTIAGVALVLLTLICMIWLWGGGKGPEDLSG